ncbi:hypothetical protein BGX27_000810 [Mortierella sp. AM989]|nr:hypothetical protein BGX27_000810 [Mortierella sp. AM989]
MFSLFQDPSMGRRPQYRQGRQNVFSPLSDSIFDPFSRPRDENDFYFGAPNANTQSPHRQQHQYQRERQSQPLNEYDAEQAQYHPRPFRQHGSQQSQQTHYSPEQQNRKQHHRSQKKQQGRQPDQVSQPGATPNKQGRRYRKRNIQDPRVLQEPVSHIDPQDSEALSDDMKEAAFGGDEELANANSEPHNNSMDGESQVSESNDSLEQEDVEDSEEEHILPNRELRQKSRAELEQIESSLEDLSNELNQVISGEIANKKQILYTEENLTKAMLKIDAVESGGDASIRQKRKEMINRAEELLAKVDEYKRLTKTSITS